MYTVENVIEPKYVNQDGSAIDCKVKFFELADYMPFCATSYDIVPYGLQIHSDCVAGKYGPVEPYHPPGIPVVEAGTND